VLFVLAGVNHFAHTPFYLAMMPAYLPWHQALVYLSGVAEIALGLLMCLQRYARVAGWGMIGLLIAVFPANLQMALHPDLYPGYRAWALWLRLPLQLPLIAWAYWYTRRQRWEVARPHRGRRCQ
jgi:uncharacterized membrane protein